MRTQKQITRQIEGLKKERETLPEIGGLGTNNWRSIDAQIDILTGVKDQTDFEEAPDDVYGSANDAADWVNEECDDDLF